MRLFGLTGYPLGHSWSEEYFRNKFLNENLTECVYQNFPAGDINEIRQIIKRHPDLEGLNVTIPHKINILSVLDEIDPEAIEIGAVNCISIKKKAGQLILSGFNTDAPAFLESLKPELRSGQQKALVLGTGGSSRAVCHALRKLQTEFLVVSRNAETGHLTYQDLDVRIISSHNIIINTTPLGMWPEISTLPPIPYHLITADHLLYDLVYNPKETIFLKKGKEMGAMVKNGLEMLKLQAEMSWKIWNH